MVNKNSDIDYQTHRLYSGQRFEYQFISDLYSELKWDAFKMPIDYGFDVVAIPSPVAPDDFSTISVKREETSNEQNISIVDNYSKILFAQIKSYTLFPKGDENELVLDAISNYSKNEKMKSTTCFYTDIDLNPNIKKMTERNNVCSILAFYLDITKIKDQLYISRTEKDKVKNEREFDAVKDVYMVWLPYDQLNELNDSGWLEQVPGKDKTWRRLYLRFQGEYITGNHSLEFWIHNPNKMQAVPIIDRKHYSLNKKIFEKENHIDMSDPKDNYKEGFEKYFENLKTSDS